MGERFSKCLQVSSGTRGLRSVSGGDAISNNVATELLHMPRQ